MTYSIGSRVFDDLQGDIVLPKPHHDIEARSGQDGLTVFAGGVRGVPFEMQSLFVESSWVNAHSLLATYYGDPSLTPVNIVRGTADYAATNYRFIVLDVQVKIETAISWYGRRLGVLVQVSPAYLVRATWKMVAVLQTGSPGGGGGGPGGEV